MLTIAVTLALANIGDVTTIVGSGTLSGPRDVAISEDGTSMWVTDSDNHVIRHVTLPGAQMTTLAGMISSPGHVDAVGTSATFNQPSGIVATPDTLYVCDQESDIIRKIDRSTLAVSTWIGVAGSNGGANGVGTNALLENPM